MLNDGISNDSGHFDRRSKQVSRLTNRTSNGPALAMPDGITSEEEARVILMDKFRQACAKLADYEDIGEPDDIRSRLECLSRSESKCTELDDTLNDTGGRLIDMLAENSRLRELLGKAMTALNDLATRSSTKEACKFCEHNGEDCRFCVFRWEHTAEFFEIIGSIGEET